MQKVQDLYDDDGDFEMALSDAEMNAANDWEEKFVADMKAKFEQYGRRMFISDSQHEQLERIASDDR